MIPLDKNSGLRLIHVAEVLQQIAGKVIVTHPRGDILTSVGFLQVFTGHKVEYESLIHAMLTIYEEQSAEAVLLVKGSSAFNSVNRNASHIKLNYMSSQLHGMWEIALQLVIN